MNDATLILDELDHLANEAFPGLVVRKDLLRRMRSAYGVPAFVIEFLLGKYCASTDEEVIREGLEFVRETLSAKYVKPDEREAVKSSIKQHSSYEIIDKISVRLVETHDKYWGRLSNLNLDYINSRRQPGARTRSAVAGRHLGRDRSAVRRRLRLQTYIPHEPRRDLVN
jgi:ATP-dependent Lon protease